MEKAYLLFRQGRASLHERCAPGREAGGAVPRLGIVQSIGSPLAAAAYADGERANRYLFQFHPLSWPDATGA